MLLTNAPILHILIGHCHQTLNNVPNTQFTHIAKNALLIERISKSFFFPKGWSLFLSLYYCLSYTNIPSLNPSRTNWSYAKTPGSLPRQVQRSKKFLNIVRSSFASSTVHTRSWTCGTEWRGSLLDRSHARDSLASIPLAPLPLQKRSL